MLHVFIFIHIFSIFQFWNNAITSKDNNGERKLMVQDDCVRLTLDLLGECILGYKFDSVHGGNNETAQAFNDVITSSDVGVGRTLFQQLIQLLPFSKAAIHVKEQSETASKTIRQVKSVNYFLKRTEICDKCEAKLDEQSQSLKAG